MEPPVFQPFGVAHLTVIMATGALPFFLASVVRKAQWPRGERVVAHAFAGVLGLNYIAYAAYVWKTSTLYWENALPFQLCDWAMVAIIVALLTGRVRWLEVAYFWGLGGTVQAIITPNLRHGFPDIRFLSFFVGHGAIVAGIVFLMVMRGYRPEFRSIFRVFAWTELYFVVTFTVDLLTGVNYGFLLHKPEAFSLLSYLSDERPIYLFQMHLLAFLFFFLLYAPFGLYDLVRRRRGTPS